MEDEMYFWFSGLICGLATGVILFLFLKSFGC